MQSVRSQKKEGQQKKKQARLCTLRMHCIACMNDLLAGCNWRKGNRAMAMAMEGMDMI
jgi:cytochrome c-type biogenesis protein CcmH/NrfF